MKQLDLKIRFQEVLDLLAREGLVEMSVGNLATRLAEHLPGRSIQTAFHTIHRFAHKMPGWQLTFNAKHVKVLRKL